MGDNCLQHVQHRPKSVQGITLTFFLLHFIPRYHRHLALFIFLLIKKFTLYLLIHKVHIATILDFLKTVTSRGIFAWNSSVKLLCNPLHLRIRPPTPKLFDQNGALHLSLIEFTPQSASTALDTWYVINVKREDRNCHIYVSKISQHCVFVSIFQNISIY